MYNSKYYSCEQIDQRLLQNYLDDYNTYNNTNLTKDEFLSMIAAMSGKAGTVDNLVAQIGYYVCDTASGTAAKVINVANYSLMNGGSIKVKFVNKNTANNATLNISNQGAKALYYQGERVSSSNTWESNEVVDIFYDGESYYANNIEGGSGEGIYDVSVNNLSEGQLTTYSSLASALAAIPNNRRKAGMSIKFIDSEKNEYVQYRFLGATTDDFTNVANWQGVDSEPTAGSNNMVKSGGVEKKINLLQFEIGGIDSTTGEDTTGSVNRARSIGFINYPLTLTSNNSDFDCRLYVYNADGTFVSTESWSDTITITDLTKLYRIILRKKDNTTFKLSWLSNYTYNSAVVEKTKVLFNITRQLSESYNSLNTYTTGNINSLNNKVNRLNNFFLGFEQGGIDSTTGEETASTNRLRSKEYIVNPVIVKANDGYQLRVYTYVNDALSNSGSFTKENIELFDFDNKKYRILVKNDNNTNISEYEPFIIYSDAESIKDLHIQVNSKRLKILNIGSSFSVNTFVQFPAIAIAGGIDCIAGCLYTGGATLADIVAIIEGDGNFSSGRIYTNQTNAWSTTSNNIDDMLALYDWDIIILQRSAPNKTGGSDSWTISMANDLETIIQYIQANTDNNPKIVFSSSFSRSVEASVFAGSREAQKASVQLIMSTAKDMQEQFGLEVIPAAIAIQNARNTSLSYVQTYNSSGHTIPDLTGEGEHLDTGVGSYILGCLLYEFILGKMFNMSILTNTVLPTLANVTNNGCFADSNFTQITQEQAQIARYAAMCAVRDPWIINDGLAERFPYPTA